MNYILSFIWVLVFACAPAFAQDTGKILTATNIESMDSDKSYIYNGLAEVNAAKWSCYADSAGTKPVDGTGGTVSDLTWTRSTVTPLRDKGSFVMQKSGSISQQGMGCSYDFKIDDSQKAKVLSIKFEYRINGGTFAAGTKDADSDVTIWIYDKTNSKLIQPSTYKLYSNSTGISDVFQGEFQTASDSVDYRLIYHIGSTNTSPWALKIDQIKVTPSKYVYGTPITDWEAFTPTGTWTINTTYSGLRRRVGGNAEFQVRAVTSGAPNNVQLNVNVPVTIDTNRLANSANGVQQLGSATLLDTGVALKMGVVTYDTATSVRIVSLDASSATLGNSPVDATTPITWGNTDSIQATFSVPVVGWSSSVQMSDNASTRVVAFATSNQSATSQTVTTSITKITTMAAKSLDTHSAWDAANNWYVVPVSGIYRVSGGIRCGALTPTNFQIGVFATINGSINHSIGAQSNQTAGNTVVSSTGSVLVDVVSGNTISLGGQVVSGSATCADYAVTYLNIEKVSGPSAIAATETVSVILNHSSGQSIPNAVETTVTGWTKEEDTHSAFNAATGEFRAPTSGLYEMDAILHLSTMSATGTRNMTVTKNGSIINVSPVEQNISGQLGSLIISSKVRLMAGDTIKFTIYQGSGSAVGLTNGGVYNRASITKIGL